MRIPLPSSRFRLPALHSVNSARSAAITACSGDLPFFDPPRPTSAHERYADGLERAGLDSTALGRDWMSAAATSIRQPLTVSLPFREVGYFAANEAREVGYAVWIRDGQKLSAVVETN